MGTYLPATGNLSWGFWHGSGTPCSQDIPPEFLPTTHRCGTSPFRISAPPTSLDGCGFFNSIVVRLPFNKISDGSEWWFFYILVVILMWLWEEVSHVYLRCHLDQKSTTCIFNGPAMNSTDGPSQWVWGKMDFTIWVPTQAFTAISLLVIFAAKLAAASSQRVIAGYITFVITDFYWEY